MGVLGWLTILFTAAKLFGFIDWSWWLVLSPAIIGVVVTVVFLVLAVIAKLYSDS